MTGFILSLLVAHGGFFLERFGGHGAMGKVMGGLADRVITLKITSAGEEASAAAESDADADSDTDEGGDLEILPPVPAVPPVPPVPSVPPVSRRKVQVDRSGERRDLPHFSERAKNVPTAEVLHRIARTAGWTMTLVGSPKERIDVDVKDAD